MRSLFLLAVAVLTLGACQSVERTADRAAEGIEDGADAVANVASAAYDGARDLLGRDAVADDARVAVARIAAPTDTTTGVRGTVTFVELDNGGVYVAYDLMGLSPGAHGFHVHAGRSCGPMDDDDDGAVEAGGAAMGHFNPMDSPHGAPDDDADERHAGDLGNITASAGGMAEGEMDDEVLSFDGSTSIVGHAMMIHGGRDDLTSQPSGDAGARIGCGLITLTDRSRM